jgi:hypothetical protein
MKSRPKIQKETYLKCINKHYPIYIVLFICLYILSERTGFSFILCILTFIVISYIGYVSHYTSHCICYTKLFLGNTGYHNLIKSTFIKKVQKTIKGNKYLYMTMTGICKVLDFHRDVHHNSEINGTTMNIINECLNNALFQGLGFMFFIWLGNLLNKKIILFWILLYVSVHNINYNIKKSFTHMEHHTDVYKNMSFGFDLWDIILGTGVYTEYRADIIINIIAITLIFEIFK